MVYEIPPPKPLTDDLTTKNIVRVLTRAECHDITRYPSGQVVAMRGKREYRVLPDGVVTDAQRKVLFKAETPYDLWYKIVYEEVPT